MCVRKCLAHGSERVCESLKGCCKLQFSLGAVNGLLEDDSISMGEYAQIQA